MAPHTYHADKMTSESLVNKGERNYGSNIQSFTKVPSSFVLACLAVKNTTVALQCIYYLESPRVTSLQ